MAEKLSSWETQWLRFSVETKLAKLPNAFVSRLILKNLSFSNSGREIVKSVRWFSAAVKAVQNKVSWTNELKLYVNQMLMLVVQRLRQHLLLQSSTEVETYEIGGDHIISRQSLGKPKLLMLINWIYIFINGNCMWSIFLMEFLSHETKRYCARYHSNWKSKIPLENYFNQVQASLSKEDSVFEKQMYRDS